MQIFENLNSPLQEIDTINGVELWMKREDLIHPEVSGNKWRKLKYYLRDFRESGKTGIITFGGAFSNHIAATAALGKIANIPTMALIRGREIGENPTLDFCRSCGMEIKTLSREEYNRKDDADFREEVYQRFPGSYIIPEGGKGNLGICGCLEILSGVSENFDIVCCSGGTGTTMTGLLLSGYNSQFYLFPALKGGGFLKEDIEKQIVEFQKEFSTTGLGKISLEGRLQLQKDYHFGGYGKIKAELIDFMNGFYRKYAIPLDPIYTGKMMYGIFDLIKNGKIKSGSRILAIHTGGLQGIKGMNERLKKSGKQIEYED